MSTPNIAKYYDEIVEDASLLGLFLGEGVYITSKAPCHGCSLIQANIREVFCLSSIPCHLGEDQGGVCNWDSPKVSGEPIPIAILITNWS